MQVSSLYLKFVLQLHALICIWILLGRYESDLWLDFGFHDDSDGWITRNIEFYENLSYPAIYVHSMSLITETISKVGYGITIGTLNAREMLYLILVIAFNMNTLTMLFYTTNKLRLG